MLIDLQYIILIIIFKLALYHTNKFRKIIISYAIQNFHFYLFEKIKSSTFLIRLYYFLIFSILQIRSCTLRYKWNCVIHWSDTVFLVNYNASRKKFVDKKNLILMKYKIREQYELVSSLARFLRCSISRSQHAFVTSLDFPTHLSRDLYLYYSMRIFCEMHSDEKMFLVLSFHTNVFT